MSVLSDSQTVGQGRKGRIGLELASELIQPSGNTL